MADPAQSSPDAASPDDSQGRSYHIFVSYRVRTDATFAERLTDKLQINRVKGEDREILIKCFLDQQSLRQGEDYMTQFLAALRDSCLFLPIVSEANVAALYNMEQGGTDNVLMEWELALELASTGSIDIIPLLLGSTVMVDGAQTYRRFSAFNLDRIPDVYSAHGGKKMTVRETVGRMLRLQGLFVNPADLSEKISALIEKFSKDVWPKYRHMWHDQSIIGPEPVLVCVQCGQDYLQSTNAEGSCRFHSVWNGNKGGVGVAPCCDKKEHEGCKRNNHRKSHHNEYPYAAKSEWAAGIVNYTNMRDVYLFISADDHNMDSSESATIEIGIVRDNHPDEGKVYIAAWANNRKAGRWFMTFNYADVTTSDTARQIFEHTDAKGTIARGQWVIDPDDPMIIGMEVECTTPTCIAPAKARVMIRWPGAESTALPEPVTIEELSRPIFGERPINGTIVLPPPKIKGKMLTIPRTRKPQDPKVWSTTPRMRIQVKETEQSHNYSNWDQFVAEMLVINTGDRPIGLLSANAWWKLAPAESEKDRIVDLNGGKGAEWEDADDINAREAINDIRNAKQLPLQVPPFGTLKVRVSCGVKETAGGKNFSHQRVSWMTRLCPVHVDFELEDLEGEKCGAVVEFLWEGAKRTYDWVRWDEDREKTDLFMLTCDDVPAWERGRAVVVQGENGSVHKLRQIVVRAERIARGETVDDENAEDGSSASLVNGTRWVEYSGDKIKGELWFLVNLRARRVYGLKILLHSSTTSTVGYYQIPPYGDALLGEVHRKESAEPRYMNMTKWFDAPMLEGVDASDEASPFVDEGYELYSIDPPSEFDTDVKGRQERGWAFPSRYIDQPKLQLLPRSERTSVNAPSGGGGSGGASVDMKAMEEMVRRVVREEVEKSVRGEVERAVRSEVGKLEGELVTVVRAQVGRSEAEVDRIIRRELDSRIRGVEDLVARLGRLMVGDQWKP
ncbi:hypothetical protein BJ742DRAFT_796348 [Cladochytrium replicatum]|nr:hypothetical protein BJ742DRAFT_796348 [Cladochytrium replicatum]